jgi:hypothetical protein
MFKYGLISGFFMGYMTDYIKYTVRNMMLPEVCVDPILKMVEPERKKIMQAIAPDKTSNVGPVSAHTQDSIDNILNDYDSKKKHGFF